MVESCLLLAAAPLLTREIFGNIPPWAQGLFYILATVATASFAWGWWRRIRLWRRGRPAPRPRIWPDSIRQFGRDVLLQRRVRGRGLASLAHLLLFSGFVVLLIGTTLLSIEHFAAAAVGREPSNPLFHKGLYYAVYEFVMDTFGIALLAGCVLFAKRHLHPPSSLGHNALDWVVLAAFFSIGVTGYVVEGLRIIVANTPLPQVSYIGLAVARLWQAAGLGEESARPWHYGFWWLHAILALTLVAAIPYTRLLHFLAGWQTLSGHRPPLGTLPLVTMESVESTGRFGASELEDFTRPQLTALDACVSCGRCVDACPAFEAGKPLSPRDVVQDIRVLLGSPAPPVLHGETIAAETLWSCTMCTACADVCPLGVRPLDYISDLRRHLVGSGGLRGAPAASLEKTQRSGNPWGLPAGERFAWAAGLSVSTVEESPDFEILYWVGCAAAYDRRIQKVARSVVRLLSAAGVRFAVLGKFERCTGESARRIGDEFVFQELATQNIATLARHGVRRIITHCPHCLNSFRQDYPQLGGNYEVVHHSQYLQELLDAGRLKLNPPDGDAPGRKITYHDPCYLARVHDVTTAPRDVLEMASTGPRPQSQIPNPKSQIKEMPRHGRQTSCCGAGGGRMWFDDALSERVGRGRVREALATGAATVAVACPFCMIMLSDGIAAENPAVQVRDIAELLAERLPPT